MNGFGKISCCQVYGELADDARHELEQHVARCADCAAELKAEQEFHALLEQDRASDPLLGDPSPNLLAASRMRLQEGLETVKQGSFFSRLAFDPANWLLQMKFSPALAAVILIFGFAGGLVTMHEVARPIVAVQGPNAGSYAAGSDRSFDCRHQFDCAGSGYQSGQHQVQHGIDAGSAGAAERSEDPAVAAVSRRAIITTQACGWIRLTCWRSGSSDLQVREALMYALQNDTNPGVRLKSLDALGNYVKNDTNVRDAVLRALVNDENSGVRIEALRLIEPVKADGSVRGVLMALAAKDSEPVHQVAGADHVGAVAGD